MWHCSQQLLFSLPPLLPWETTPGGTRLCPNESPQYMMLSFSSPLTNALWMPSGASAPSFVTLPLRRPFFDQTKYWRFLGSHLRFLTSSLGPKAHNTVLCTNCLYFLVLWLLMCISEFCRCAPYWMQLPAFPPRFFLGSMQGSVEFSLERWRQRTWMLGNITKKRKNSDLLRASCLTPGASVSETPEPKDKNLG